MKKVLSTLFFAFIYIQTYCQVNLTQGLVAYYPLNNNANDASGNNRNGTLLNGTSFGVDRFGVSNNAATFDGINDYIRITDNGGFSTPVFSIVAWFRTESDALQTLIGKRDYSTSAGTGGAQYQMAINYAPYPGVLSNLVGNNSTCNSIPFSSYINTQDILCSNRWNCIIITFDGSRHKLYLNGILKRDEPTSFNSFLNCGRDLRLGNGWELDPQSFKGQLDDVRWYNRPLTTDEINILNENNSSCTSLNCNNWLSLPAYQSYVSIGDLDITGNQITVEATFMRTAPYTGGQVWAGDLVSKHTDPNDANYLLRPNNAEITTSNGYFRTPDICEIELNKTYHAAFVYNGSTLKFYRNGYLMSSVAASGTLFQNNLMTRIGLYDGNVHNTNLIGYINEVRIWNTARSQTDIRTFMNTPLPNPTTQTGLLAYYSFNNLLNKQGNTAFNGTLGGSAVINSTNPSCSFTADSCDLIPVSTRIINDYSPVTGFDICKNILTVEDGTLFKTSDTVLLIQMKGAVIDSSNTGAFGTITNYRNAGNHEFNYVKSVSGNNIELKNILTRSYDIPDGVVQLIRVPYFTNIKTTDIFTCLPWDGKKGGVLVLNSADTVELNANIDVSGRGFRGGTDPVSTPASFFCSENNFFYNQNPDLASEKGEGIAVISNNKSFGKGALANGGGGGNSHNSGGGGGGNAASGGLGGYQFEGSPCNSVVPFDNRGLGGKALLYNNTQKKLFMGGGGGAGQSNNPEGFQGTGGNGAGIVILIAKNLKSNSHKIIANGTDGVECGDISSGCHEGMGGGGGGGAVVLDVLNFIGNNIVEAKGGKGGNVTSDFTFLKVGPGGGGGGGLLWLKSTSLPAAVSAQLNGGANGVVTQSSNNPWGAAAGANGLSVFNLQLPIATAPFKPNIDSVRITKSNACNSFNFNGLAYTNTTPITTWQWFFGDGGTANTQDASHTYSASNNFTVKLIATDANGCKDSFSIPVSIPALPPVPAALLAQPTCSAPLGSITVTSPLGANLQYSINGTTYQTSTVFSNLPPATYQLTVKNTGNSCISPAQPVTINIPAGTPAAPAVTTVTQPNCVLTTGSFTISNPIGSNLQYSIDGINYQSSLTFSNLQPGPYSVRVRNTLNSCVSSLTPVTINPVPPPPTDPVLTVTQQPNCFLPTGSIQVTAPSGNDLQYSLNGGAYQSSNTFTGLVPGPYQITVRNTTTFCVSQTASAVINALPLPPVAPIINTIIHPTCIKPTGSFSILSPRGTDLQYSVNGTDYQNSPNFSGISAGPYTVTVVNSVTGCVSAPVPITINPVPPAPAAPLATVTVQPSCFNASGTILITSPTGTNFEYSINGIVYQPSFLFSNLGIGNYQLTVRDRLTGCISSSTAIDVIPNLLQQNNYFIANAFTPNGDGTNDCFGIKDWGVISEFRLMVYNRWGEEVFFTNNPFKCWDGNFKGLPAVPGNYVYYVRAVSICGTVERKGNLALIR